MKTIQNLRKWTLAGAMAAAVGGFAIVAGVASADPDDGGIGIGGGSDTNGRVNVGPVQGGVGSDTGGGVHVGPGGISGGAGTGTGGGVNVGPGR